MKTLSRLINLDANPLSLLAVYSVNNRQSIFGQTSLRSNWIVEVDMVVNDCEEWVYQ